MSPRRVVVVGHGMAGCRLAEEIRRHDRDAERVELTVLGAEPEHAYNRVLLSEVIAGTLDVEAVRLHDENWAPRHAVDLRLGAEAVAIDPERREVSLADSTTVDYDALVLATGADPWLPPVQGLRTEDGSIAPGATTVRTTEDCQHIIDRARPGVQVAILGGGVLGLEVARGLAGRGCLVTVVHVGGVLMDRQLDASSSQVLVRRFSEFGVEFRLNAKVTRYLPGHGLDLADGTRVPADLVVVCTGARPDTGVANRAGIAVDAGVLIDDALRTSMPRVYAIGDCAQHQQGGLAGLVRPAWQQAAVLAELLTGTNPAARYRPTAAPTRLKARGIELLTLGDVQTDVHDPDAEVLRLEDPTRGRYAKVILRSDRVTGAILLGLPDAAATITQLHERGGPAPADRLALLLGRALPSDATPVRDPTDLPATTVICRCNTVSKAQLVKAWRAGARDLTELASTTRATTGCGSCRDQVCGLLDWLAAGEPE